MCRLVPVSGLATDPEGAARFAAWAQVFTACAHADMGAEHDARSVAELREAARSTSYHRRAVAAADDAGQVVGAAGVTMSVRDNLRHAFVQIGVLPPARRAGVGSGLHRWVLSVARQAGRTILQAQTVAPPSRIRAAGDGFAEAMGWTAAQRYLRYDLHLTQSSETPAPWYEPAAEPGASAAVVPTSEVPACGTSSDYTIRTWTDGLPDESLGQRAELAARMTSEIPLGGLALEAQVWDADRMREEYARKRAMGRHTITTVAVEAGSGRFVGFTEVDLSAVHPERAFQQDTLVLPEHRGRGLGMRLKRANTRAVRAHWPQVRAVRTWNAEENTPMRAVNEDLGYVESGRTIEWQLLLD